MPDAKVEHVGASSIPGAISKGDLDICVAVSPGLLESTIPRLNDLGFVEKQETLRTSALCMLESTKDDDVAVQLVEQGTEYDFFVQCFGFRTSQG